MAEKTMKEETNKTFVIPSWWFPFVFIGGSFVAFKIAEFFL